MPTKLRGDTQPEKRDGRSPTVEDVDSRLARIWKRAYEARSKEELERLYAEWAETYDADHDHVGFFGHRLAAEVLARHTTRHDVAHVLDAGAGTGAAGVALAALGFRNLVAVDLSPAMLEKALEKGVYRETLAADLSLPVDAFTDGAFDAAILVGVFSYGQAPAETLDEVLRLVRPGGVVVLTMRTDFFEQDAMGLRGRMAALEREGRWSLLERTEPRPYLPAKDPRARFRVWCYRVLERGEPEVEDGFEDAVREAFASDDWVVRLDHAWIWDTTGSRLYERYTRTKGYYLTECEESILREKAAEIAGDEPLVVELGCGSARKVRHLLRARLAGGATSLRYMPIDVSPGALAATAAELRRLFPEGVRVEPAQGMFEDVLHAVPAQPRKLVLFFGSSIGNLESLGETVAFLRRVRAQLRPGDRWIVGIDLHKDEDVLERAYNEEDACRSFFVHMVRRINENLGADFDPRVFELSSTYEEEPPHEGVRAHVMNLRVAPSQPQHTWVRKLGMEVQLEKDQPVQVGISRKLEPEAIAALARLGGFRLERQWLDARRWFSLNELVPEAL